MLMRPDALVFDLDGTLIDSAADLALILNRLLAERGRAEVSPDSVRGMIGNGIGALVARGFAATGAPLDAATHAAAARRFLDLYLDPDRPHHAKPYPGVIETLTGFAAQAIPMGVCTNKTQVATEMVLREAGLAAFFDSVVGHDRAPMPKPAPAHVLAVCRALGDPQAAVMIGDSVNDLQAGQAAGLKVVLVTYGYGTPQALAAADARIDRFDALPVALAGLAA